MLDFETATAKGDKVAADRADRMVTAFTNQLDESNPILTQISDAMTLEADSIDAAEITTGAEREKHLEVAKEQNKIKEQVCLVCIFNIIRITHGRCLRDLSKVELKILYRSCTKPTEKCGGKKCQFIEQQKLARKKNMRGVFTLSNYSIIRTKQK